MRLHSYAASANCLKVRCLLSLLDLDYELVETDIFEGDTLTDAFGRLNPLRETPVLELDGGVCIAQSNAILQYLAEGSPWAGVTREERGLVSAWLHFEQERVMTGVGGTRFWLLTGRATAEQIGDRLAAGRAALSLLDRHLDGRLWLVGERPTIADVAVWAYGHLALDAGFDLTQWPQVSAWSQRSRALPGWVEQLQPYPENARAGRGRSVYDAPPNG